MRTYSSKAFTSMGEIYRMLLEGPTKPTICFVLCYCH